MLRLLRSRSFRAVVVGISSLSMLVPSGAMAQDAVFGVFSREPATPVERLARQIDKLEKHIDENGSIVIKAPDVWGESRLMQHRSEVEMQLKARLNTFNFRINAIQSTRDAAFLATAVALQEQIASQQNAQAATATTPAIPARPGDVGPLTGNVPQGTNVNYVNSAVAGMITAQASPPQSAFLGATNTGGLEARTLQINVEPVIELDQLNRYLQHLNELRRLNEGDDNSDAPGYSLNLIRIPVSVLPGRRTEQGFGAEVQITVDSYLSDEILPMAFKDFVINGVSNRISFQIFEVASRAPMNDLQQILLDYYGGKKGQSQEAMGTAGQESSVQDITRMRLWSSGAVEANLPDSYQNMSFSKADEVASLVLKATGDIPVNSLDNEVGYNKAKNIMNTLSQDGTFTTAASGTQILDIVTSAANENDMATFKRVVVNLEQASQTVKSVGERLGEVYDGVNPLAGLDHHDLSVAPSAFNSVDGHTLHVISLECYRRLVAKDGPLSGEVKPALRFERGLSMPSVKNLLDAELQQAYQFLSEPSMAHLWTEFCTPELASQVREIRKRIRPEYLSKINEENKANDPTWGGLDDPRLTEPGIFNIRKRFFEAISLASPHAKSTVTASLAWQIIVEASLVNEQLLLDMRQTASLKNCPCIPVDCMSFVGPNPAPEARHAFCEYVRCKWPIHVFALDPVTQDQNISDNFSQRREMQMALAIAASNRLLGGQAMSRFVRRMEYDLETIDLNRTAIAFSHGDNSFGWRFYPRVQSPPVPSTVSTITHDLLIGGQDRNKLLNTRRLEPGIRECTALVVMPSFVPQILVDVRTDWFRLAKHVPFHPFNKKKPDHEDSMELSKQLTDLRNLQTECMRDAHKYRDGDVFRLCKAVERLEDRLPMQTHHVPVPWENDLSGFEVFQSGIQVLGPEIHGWYGAPGIKVVNTQLERNLLASFAVAQRNLSDIRNAILVERANRATEARIQQLTADEAKINAEIARITTAIADAEKLQTSTAVFLVGKNFSVLNCRVIAGGVDVTNSIQVINRNLIQVRIPSTVSTVSAGTAPEQQNVVVHLATPYGATSRLLIPVAGATESAAVSDAKKAADEAAKSAKASSDALSAMQSQLPHKIIVGLDDKPREFPLSVDQQSQPRNAPLGFGENVRVHRVLGDLDVEEKSGDMLPTSGKVLFRASVTGSQDAPKRLGVYEVANGTASVTYSELYKRAFGELGFVGSSEVVVAGFVKLNDDQQPIVPIKNKIVFKVQGPKP